MKYATHQEYMMNLTLDFIILIQDIITRDTATFIERQMTVTGEK